MLFLFNDRVLEIGNPEVRLMANWPELGCGRPDLLFARDAIDFAKALVIDSDHFGVDEALYADCAALLAVKTHANTAFFIRAAGEDVASKVEARLTLIPEEHLKRVRNQRRPVGAHASLEPLWVRAA
ncbi:MAG: hypothetical protein CMK06_08995 [Ponticaulis sp.]|nr:hypothetical protein [Ponticaulis sp.]|tara:strand:- start:2579 stop:2959 length:381 start_codon:yes stop_codon:yes gene_type:complete